MKCTRLPLQQGYWFKKDPSCEKGRKNVAPVNSSEGTVRVPRNKIERTMEFINSQNIRSPQCIRDARGMPASNAKAAKITECRDVIKAQTEFPKDNFN